MAIVIPEPKGLAKRAASAHCYILPDKLIQIKTKIITETEDSADDLIKPGEGPQNIELTKQSTEYVVYEILPGSNSPIQKLFEQTVEGQGSDEDCLAAMGYYLADYDELQEAKRIRRLVDISKFL
jgi:hypothetical protein